MNKPIAIIVGSLRKESLNQKLAQTILALAPSASTFKLIDIKNLPLYNQDLDDEHTPPDAWVTFRQQIKACSGVLFITPEYNRSMPAAIKNAIDVGSRPYGQSVWNGMPGAVISSSPGAIGGFGANHHLRQSLMCLNVLTLQQPEAYIGQAHTLFNEQGEMINKDTLNFIEQFITTFTQWVTAHSKNQ